MSNLTPNSMKREIDGQIGLTRAPNTINPQTVAVSQLHSYGLEVAASDPQLPGWICPQIDTEFELRTLAHKINICR